MECSRKNEYDRAQRMKVKIEFAILLVIVGGSLLLLAMLPVWNWLR